MHSVIIICLTISFFTLIIPDTYNLPSSLSGLSDKKQIIGIISLLIAYYYWNNEKLF
jgi:hypothetical protein